MEYAVAQQQAARADEMKTTTSIFFFSASASAQKKDALARTKSRSSIATNYDILCAELPNNTCLPSPVRSVVVVVSLFLRIGEHESAQKLGKKKEQLDGMRNYNKNAVYSLLWKQPRYNQPTNIRVSKASFLSFSPRTDK